MKVSGFFKKYNTMMLKEIKSRIKEPTPVFWKKFGNYCLLIGGITSIVGGGIIVYKECLGSIIITIGSTLAAVGKFLSEMTIMDKIEK
jgi:hypothetical protein